VALLGQMQLWEAAAVKVGLALLNHLWSLPYAQLKSSIGITRIGASSRPRRVGLTPGGVER
jgi:hypothetical protein